MLNQIDLSRVDLNLLVLFEAVYEERHVGRTGGRLSLSASAVSHGLGRLRRLMGDPLFLRTPKGVVPTPRAEELSPAIAGILAQTRSMLSLVQPFDPATSARRFIIGAPDGVSGVFLPDLIAYLHAHAPRIDISVSQLLPASGETSPQRAWRWTFDALDRREMDIAVIPFGEVPARFEARPLYQEDFVIAVRCGHPFERAPTLDHYCDLQHLVVSVSGDPRGFIDDVLEGAGQTRRIALTAPNFLLALALVAETDLLVAVPRRLAQKYAKRMGISIVELPISTSDFPLTAIASKSALADDAVAWMTAALQRCASTSQYEEEP